MPRTFTFIFFVKVSQVGQSIVPYWLDQGVGVKGAMGGKFVSKAVDENWDGLNVQRVVQVGSGGTSEMVTDDLETLCTCVKLACLRLKLWFCTQFSFCALVTQRYAYFCPSLYRHKFFKLFFLYAYGNLLIALCIAYLRQIYRQLPLKLMAYLLLILFTIGQLCFSMLIGQNNLFSLHIRWCDIKNADIFTL